MLIFEVYNSFGNRAVYPKSKDCKIQYEEGEGRKIDFSVSVSDMMFIGEDFEYFLGIEKSDKRCDRNTLTITTLCNGVHRELFKAFFSMANGTWNLDKGTVRFKMKSHDPYGFMKSNNAYNLLEISNRNNTSIMPLKYALELVYGIISDEHMENTGYTYFGYKQRSAHSDNKIWGIEYAETDCNDILSGSGWTRLACNNFGKRGWNRKSTDIAVPEYVTDVYLQNMAQYIPMKIALGSFWNGVLLRDAFNFLLHQRQSGLRIKSDFFQWEPDYSTTINYVTNRHNELRKLVLYPIEQLTKKTSFYIGGQEPTIAKIKFSDLLKDVVNLFNLGYVVEGNYFRLEHISWFYKNNGIDLTELENKQLLKGTNVYSYDSDKLPKEEIFEIKHAFQTDFVGMPISYDSFCVQEVEESDESNDSPNKHKVQHLFTDVFGIVQNRKELLEVKEGFALVANDEDNMIYTHKALFGNTLCINAPLSWASLHDKYWRHGRVLPRGRLNGAVRTFRSVVPTKMQTKINMVFCCTDFTRFKPRDRVKTEMGWGIIKSAEFDLFKNTMQFSLKYE